MASSAWLDQHHLRMKELIQLLDLALSVYEVKQSLLPQFRSIMHLYISKFCSCNCSER